jgi:hypothetical protein
MAKLTAEQLKTRLKMDYQVLVKMRSPLMTITAYRNADDLNKRRNPIVSEEEGHLATHYLVDYYIRTLVGRDEYSDKTSVKFDLLANGNYPYTIPGCYVASSRLPWTPHFKARVPICTDYDMWEGANGRLLLADWVIHVAKLLNFDEIPRTENYGGFNPEAARYWREKLNMQPLTPNLHYPSLPTVEPDKSSIFSAIQGNPSDMFQAASQSRVDLFQPATVDSQARALSPGSEMFAPAPNNQRRE